ncbi:hypothetical protein [Poseidonibacter ostreae]|uniref:Type II secretion system protein GspF domain-containing protein n=1 Tax=Poseidonibacter ostreae TaxID=2654171 RepID=A0A6L4WWB5_9BACT|nr:hypothetical protein [Poseidonibacter ostreae]KAB7891326.1 hypothetical protein GBG19_00385 [Poseidonibacter ostreae]
MAKMKEIDKSKLIGFVVTMQKTGKNIHKSLLHFSEKVAKDKNTKRITRDIVSQLERGISLEKALFEAEIITKFQYSILEITPDKKTAFEKILSFGNAKKEADLFYLKMWAKGFAIVAGVFIGIYLLNKGVFIDLVAKVAKGNKKLELSPFVDIVITNNITMLYIGIVFSIIFLLIFAVYVQTYKNNISLHYKLFRYKAIIENTYLISTISELLTTGINLNKSLNLLINSIEPKNLRNNIAEIREAITKNDLEKFETELGRIHIDEISNFILISGFESKSFQESFKDAEISTKVYNKQVGEHYKGLFDFIVFALGGIFLSFAIGYIVMFEVDLSLGAW